MNSEEIFNNIVNQNGKTANRREFDTQEFLKSIGLDKDNKTQSVVDNSYDLPEKNQQVVSDKSQFVAPERRSYYVASNGKEINTTAQTPREIEYEADVIDSPKNRDNYFGLIKLDKDKTSVVKTAFDNVYKYNFITAPVAIKNKLNELSGKDDIGMITEGIRGFAGSSIDFAAELYRFFRQNILIVKNYTAEQIDKIANVGNVLSGGVNFSSDIAEEYTEFYKQIDEDNKYLKDKTESFLKYTAIAKNDTDGFIYDLVGGGASLLYALAFTAITKSPTAAAAAFGMYQYQNLYEEGIDRGFSPLKSRTIGVVGGVFEAGLESVGLHLLIENFKARGSFSKILKSFLTEATQEFSQQGIEEITAKVSGLRDTSIKQIFENAFYAGVIGGILGGGSASISNLFYKKISDNATQELISKGMQQNYAQQMVENILRLSISKNTISEIKDIIRDEQSPVTYKNADPRETYKEFGDTVKKALDPQQQRGVELEFINEKNKWVQTRVNQLVEQGDSKEDAQKQAESEVAMIDAGARTEYNTLGTTPKDFYSHIHIRQQNKNIEDDERDVDEEFVIDDMSFDPVDFDEKTRAEYEAAMQAQEDEIARFKNENKKTIKQQAKILGDMGIGAIRRPTADGYGKERFAEYNDLSPRIKKAFFTDTETAMKWDEAEDLLKQRKGDTADLFDYLTTVDSQSFNQSGLTKDNLSRLIAKEKEDIKNKTIEDRTFLKAPNGEQSNLSKDLWLTVRTKAFKNWFGDWENLYKKQQLENAPIIKIQENVFVSNKNKSARQQAIEWAENTKLNKQYNTVVGTVLIDKRSIKDSLGHGYSQKKLDTVVSLKEGFRNAVYLESIKDFDNNELTNHFFVYPVTYKGKRELVFCRARKDINLNRLYVHEVFTESELKNKADDTLQTAAYEAKHGGIALYGSILQKVLNVNEENVSKVLDDNDEPLVVYHGTEDKFAVFDKNKSRLNMDIQGFFFSPLELEAKDYGKNIIPCFLSIKNPANSGSGYNALKKYQGQNGAGIKAREDLEKQGYDGVNNDNEEYIVFNPEQVKHIDNRGTFDGNNPDIYYQMGKDYYERQARNIELKNKDNREILLENGGTKEQADELENLGALRHRIHSINVNSLAIEGSEDVRNLEYGKVSSCLEEAGLPTLTTTEAPLYITQDTDDIIADYLEKDIDELTDKDIEKFNNEVVEMWAKWKEKVNNEIEDYLSKIDTKYKTHYKPTGMLREKFYQADISVTEKEKEIGRRFNNFLNKETVEIQPHESLTKKEAEQVFRNNKTVEHNELGTTNFSIETVNKILRHKGFDTSTIIKLLPEIYKNSVLIDSPTEKQYTGNKQHKKHTNIAFWHNTLNKFKIQNNKGGYDEYFVRFTVTEQYAGKKKPKGSIGEKTLHSTNISEIEIQKKDGNAANTSNYLGATLPSDDIVADYIKIVKKFNRLNQDNQNPRGATTVYDRDYYIDLFSNADKSTLQHELAHVYLHKINELAQNKNATAEVKRIKQLLDEFIGEPEDNGRYSIAQQEMFAKNFESYLKSGKAPNAKLKTVFEKFAQWLANIYDSIKNDLPKISKEAKELFDTILVRTYDIPDSNVYAGKVSAIKEVINNIKQGVASEVDGINIADVEKLLKIVYVRKPNRPSKNLQQLLKDKNIYDFNDLEKTGNKKVQEILKENGYIDDNTDEQKAMELAKSALDGNNVYRLNDQWRVKNDNDFRRNLRILEEAIGTDFTQVDGLLEKIYELQNKGYRQVEQQDVDNAKSEYKRLFSADVKEAKKIVADIIEKIKRKKFIDNAAKKQLLIDLNFSSTVEEIKESVLDVIDTLNQEITDIKEQLKQPRKPIIRKDKTIPPTKDATKEEKNTYKKYMKRQIDRLLKQALPRKQNQNKFSKFDVDTQRFFTELEKYNKMNMEQAQQELYSVATGIIDDEGIGVDNYTKLKNMFLSFKANRVDQNSTEFYKQLYDNLMEINVVGRNIKDIENTLKKEQQQQDTQDLLHNIDQQASTTGVSAGIKKQYIKWLGNWWSTINAIAGKKQADKDSLERIEIDIFNANYNKTEALKKSCAGALGLKNITDLDMVVNNFLNEEYTYNELDAVSNTRNTIKLNKMQLICCYIWLKNSILHDRIVRAYGNEQVNDMMSKLTIRDKKFGDELQQSISALYHDINKVYLKMYGLDMPQAENYFPSNVERIQGNMDLLKDNIGQVSSPGFIKARVASNLPLMNFDNPVKIALDHIAKVNHFIYMQEKIAELNKIYKTTRVKRNIVNLYGDRVYRYILQVLDNSKFTTVAKTIDGISDIGDYLVNNYVLTKIAIKPSIMIKQLLSCINYAEDMSSTKWFAGFLKGVATPKKTIDFMMTNSKYCQSRFAKGGQTEALLKAMEGQNTTFAKVKTFKGILSWMTRVGDIGAIIFGGYPYVMEQVNKGVDLKTAIENFEKATIRSQQASLPSTLSNWQYRGMNSWFYRAMFAFANTPNQYARKIGDSIYMYTHGDIDKKQLAKNLMIYGVVNSLLYTSFTSLAILSGMISGDWDDLKDDIIMSLFQCSNMLALPIFGQAYNIAVAKIFTGKFLPDKEIPLLDDMVKLMRTVAKEDLEFNDWLNVVDGVGSLAAGIPVKTIYNETVGSIKDLLDGEYGKFLVKLYGATENRADKIFN